MAVECVSSNIPVTLAGFDHEGLSGHAGEHMFESESAYMFADYFRNFSSDVYGLSENHRDPNREIFERKSSNTVQSTPGQTHLGQSYGHPHVQQAWLQPPDRDDESASNSEHMPRSSGAILDAGGDALISKCGMIPSPDVPLNQIIKQESPDPEAPRSLKSSNKPDTGCNAAANKRQSTQKPRRYSQATAESKDTQEKQDARQPKGPKEQYREKNKLAAAKCRNKKRKLNDEIETQAKNLEDQNKELKQQLRELRNSVLFYKDQILKHSPQECNCTQLHEYSMDQCARLLQHAHRPSDVSTSGRYNGPRSLAGRSVSSSSIDSFMDADARDQKPNLGFSGASESFSPADMSMETGFQPDFLAQSYDRFQPRFVSGDEMLTMSSTAVSPEEMSNFGGSPNMHLGALNNDTFEDHSFDMAWNYIR